MVAEIMMLFVICFTYALQSEMTSLDGKEKEAKAMAEIMKEIEDADGIQVTNKYVLMGLRFIIPMGLKYAVYMMNKTGFFEKSKA